MHLTFSSKLVFRFRDGANDGRSWQNTRGNIHLHMVYISVVGCCICNGYFIFNLFKLFLSNYYFSKSLLLSSNDIKIGEIGVVNIARVALHTIRTSSFGAGTSFYMSTS